MSIPLSFLIGGAAGTDVMISKIFSPKKWRFLLKRLLCSFLRKLANDTGFFEKNAIFPPKIG
jgi:hypothetical protein